MLSARASALRNAQRITRSFATVVDSAGIKVASVDNNQPTAAVTFLIKAGSRSETKPGVAHALKNFAFKSTAQRSALGTVRESELHGGVLSSTLSREYLALTAEFLRGDEEFFVSVLSSFVTSAKFTRHEFEEYVTPVVDSEIHSLLTNPGANAIELAHGLAFRSGLGSSLFASPYHSINVGDIASFASSVFTKGNIAVIGTGIDQSTLTKLLQSSSLASASSSAAPSTTPSAYFGGETRLEAHGGPETVFISFGSTGAPSPELAVLAAHLSPAPSVKWSQGTSPLSAVIPAGTTVQPVHLPYSDASLFGLLVQGESTKHVKEAASAAVKALKDSAASGGVKAEELKKAVAKAKFEAASAVDRRDGLIGVLGTKLFSNVDTSLDATLSSLDKVTATAFSKAATSLIKAKPTYVVVGDVKTLPYADELGL